MANDKDLFRSELGRALNAVTATLGYKSFETIQQEYKAVEKQFLAISDDAEFQLETRRRVSERIFGDAVEKNCSMDDLDEYYNTTAKLGFSDINPHISSTIIYCQHLINYDRKAEAKKLLEDLLNYVNEIEDANPGSFDRETFELLKSLLSNCEEEQ